MEAFLRVNYQISLTQRTKILPKFRKPYGIAAYGERWELYTESLGKGIRILYDVPINTWKLVQMHRAYSPSGGYGLHCEGWSRDEKAFNMSLANEAEFLKQGIISELNVMACRVRALSYKIGQLK